MYVIVGHYLWMDPTLDPHGHEGFGGDGGGL